jgi:hypothetical protein
MYSLDHPDYSKEFETIHELIKDILASGMDPNYEITLDGEGVGEEAWDFIVP